MSTYEDLARLGMKIEPLSDVRPPALNRRSLFSAGFSQTIDLLWSELHALGAKTPIMELDYRDRDLRQDGMPRSDARMQSPVVVLTFVAVKAKLGQLRYATGEFNDWQDNVRAIALSLQALRAVDRYGVSKRGEQYRGWKALPPSSDPADNIATAEQAQRFLDDYGGSFEDAAKRLHPDLPDGDEALFRAAVVARDVLAAA